MESTIAEAEGRPRPAGQSAADLVSVIVPVGERPEPLGDLYLEFSAPFRRTHRAFEFLFVVEPWARSLIPPLAVLRTQGEPIRILETGQSVGETAQLRLAAQHCRGSIVVTLPAYRRVEANGLLALVARVEQGFDLAAARRWPRRDSWINRVQNLAFHALLGGVAGARLRGATGAPLRDVASGVRACRREVLQEVPLYGDFARFLPLIASREGFRVEEIDLAQHARDLARRVYAPGTYLRRLIDLLGLFFLLRFTEKPLRFFGLVGSVTSLVGMAVLLVVGIQKLGGKALADRPLLLLGVLLVVLGAQAIALGLIGEVIVHLHASHRRPYRLASVGTPVLEPRSGTATPQGTTV